MRRDLRSKSGFTLIEIMIVVGIIGILAAVAVPVYRNYIDSANCSQVVGPVNSLMVALVGDFAENGTSASGSEKAITSEKASGKSYESVSVNGRTFNLPENVNVSYTRGTDNRYTITGERTDAATSCPNSGTYVLTEGSSEGTWED